MVSIVILLTIVPVPLAARIAGAGAVTKQGAAVLAVGPASTAGSS